MTNIEKILLKEEVNKVFASFNILDHTACIGTLNKDIIHVIDNMAEEPDDLLCWNDISQKEKSDFLYNLSHQKEEVISESLEEAAKQNAKIERSDDTEVGYDINRLGGFVDGAEWQKEQDRQWLAENHKHTFAKGRESMKEQMMKDAIDGEVTYGKSLAIPSLSYRLDKEGLDFGDKVKIIIIKNN